MATFDSSLQGVLNTLEQVFNQSQQTQQQLRGAYGGVAGGHMDVAKAQEQQLIAQKTIDLQEARGKLRAQENTRRAATALGTNMDDKSEIVTLLGAQMRQSALDSIAAADKVARLEANNNLFTSPLGWLRDFAVGDEAREALAASTNKLEIASNSLSKLNTATQSSAMTQSAIAETMSEATIQAQQDQLSAKILEVHAEGRKGAAAARASMLNAISDMSHRQLGYVMEANRVQQAAEDRVFNQKYKELEMQYKTSILEDKKRSSQDEQTKAALVVEGSELVGTPITAEEAQTLTSFDKPRSGMLISLALSKRAAERNGIEYRPPALGESPTESYAAWNSLGYNFSAAAEDTVRLSQLSDGAMTNSVLLREYFASMGITDPIKLDQAVNNAMTGSVTERRELRPLVAAWDMARKRSLPFVDITNNPYALPAITSLDPKILQKNPFIAQYYAPLAEAARTDGSHVFINPDELAGAAMSAIKKGEFTQGTIVEGITGLVNTLMLLNNNAREYHKLGLPDQVSATAQIGGRGADTFDLSNSTRWNEYLSKRSAREARYGIQTEAQQNVIQSLREDITKGLPISAPVLPPQ